jgi:hypothetical protein
MSRGMTLLTPGSARFSLLEMTKRLTQLLALVSFDLSQFSFSSAGHVAYLLVDVA